FRGGRGIRHRFSQRTGGQDPAVARTALVEDENLDVAAEAEVLQAVVADDHIDLRVGLQQGVAGGDAVAPDDDGDPRAPGEKERLVAGTPGVGRDIDLDYLA